MPSYSQLQDGIKDIKDFESKIANILNRYYFLNYKNKKTVKLVRRLYRLGYNISDTVSFVILNN